MFEYLDKVLQQIHYAADKDGVINKHREINCRFARDGKWGKKK